MSIPCTCIPPPPQAPTLPQKYPLRPCRTGQLLESEARTLQSQQLMQSTLRATMIQGTQAILVAIDNNAQLIRETQQEVQQTRAEVLNNRQLIQDVSTQVSAVSSQLETMQSEANAFREQFADGGSGWDSNSDGLVSATELLAVMVDLGYVESSTSTRRELESTNALETLELAATVFPLAQALLSTWKTASEGTQWGSLFSATFGASGVSIGSLVADQLPQGRLATQAKSLLDQFAGGLSVLQSTGATIWEAVETCASALVRSTVDFLECMTDTSESTGPTCIDELAEGVKNCIDPALPCKITIGGPQSTCLTLNAPAITFDEALGPLTMSGSASPTGGVQATADFQEMEFEASLIDVGFDIRINLALALSPTTSRIEPQEFPLTSEPTSLFTRTFMIGIVPLVVELEVQLVASVELSINTSAAVEVRFSHQEQVGLTSATISNTNGLHMQWDDFSPELTQSLISQTSGEVHIHHLKVSAGPRVILKLNGVGIEVTPYVQFTAAGKIGFTPSGCVSSSISTELGLRASMGFTGLDSPGAVATAACKTSACGLIDLVPGRVADCGWQALSGQDTTACEAASDVCQDFGSTIDNFIGVERSTESAALISLTPRPRRRRKWSHPTPLPCASADTRVYTLVPRRRVQWFGR